MYILYKNNFGVVDRVFNEKIGMIPFDPANTDYQQYLAWLEAENTPLPAEEQQ